MRHISVLLVFQHQIDLSTVHRLYLIKCQCLWISETTCLSFLSFFVSLKTLHTVCLVLRTLKCKQYKVGNHADNALDQLNSGNQYITKKEHNQHQTNIFPSSRNNQFHSPFSFFFLCKRKRNEKKKRNAKHGDNNRFEYRYSI